VDARNEVVQSGEVCAKCGAIRPGKEDSDAVCKPCFVPEYTTVQLRPFDDNSEAFLNVQIPGPEDSDAQCD